MIELDGERLTLDQVAATARGGEQVRLAGGAAARVRDSWSRLWKIVEGGVPVYGLTTGFGALDGTGVTLADNRAQQRNLLMSHAAGVGQPMSADSVRAMMVIRANVLASGLTGVQPETLEALIAMLNASVVPVVPEQGSVGACGDLAPLAHMSLPLIGLGHAVLTAPRPPGVSPASWEPRGAPLPGITPPGATPPGTTPPGTTLPGTTPPGTTLPGTTPPGTILTGAEAMRRAGIGLPDLRGRDGLALINGTEQASGIGALAVLDALRLVATAEVAAALSMDALRALDDCFGVGLALLKRHPGVEVTAARLRELTRGSDRIGPPSQAHLRDALSLRCVPQVLGAARDGIGFARQVLEREINAANDNPLFFTAGGGVTSNSGNFHGQAVAQALDLLATTVVSIAVMSERRTARLVDQNLSGGLPPFLVGGGAAAAGPHSGLMIAQYTAAALVAELRCTISPASVHSIPACANSEDHVPMSAIAARQAARAVATADTVVAIEALCAAQAIDLRGGPSGPLLTSAHQIIREAVPFMAADRVVAPDIESICRLVRLGALATVGPTAGDT